MKGKKIMDRTMNSSVYNKARKYYLAVCKGLIHCDYCRYHRGENRSKFYGGFIDEGQDLKDGKIKYPSWKLASKKRKQWMPKNNVELKIEKSKWRDSYWVEFNLGKKTNKSGISYSKK
jgi:hypothetical protein